jgi:hypothetical protein
MDPKTIVIVSGLPRSGTSMMMRMLEAGGIPVLTDSIRKPDEDNLRGYYEFERVKRIEHDRSWLGDAEGKAVKMISSLLTHLPPDRSYRVVFMRRKMEEILASQKRMLVRRGEPTDRVSDERMAALFEQHLRRMEAWLRKQPNMQVLYLNYNRVIEGPASEVAKIAQFLDGALDTARMMDVVDRSLYRQRGT